MTVSQISQTPKYCRIIINGIAANVKNLCELPNRWRFTNPIKYWCLHLKGSVEDSK